MHMYFTSTMYKRVYIHAGNDAQYGMLLQWPWEVPWFGGMVLLRKDIRWCWLDIEVEVEVLHCAIWQSTLARLKNVFHERPSNSETTEVRASINTRGEPGINYPLVCIIVHGLLLHISGVAVVITETLAIPRPSFSTSSLMYMYIKSKKIHLLPRHLSATQPSSQFSYSSHVVSM